MQLTDDVTKTNKCYVLGVDVGTTNIRCYAYDHLSNVVGKAEDKVQLLISGEGGAEIEPDILWETFINVVNKCLKDSKLDPQRISSIGISTQRGSFITWDKETGEPYHNFISWKDTRAESYCSSWNSSLSLKLFKFSAHLLYLVTRKNQFQVISSVKFTTTMVIMRLLWVLDHIPEVREKSRLSKVLFGTIDTWLVWKLTGGDIYATDASNACVTGFFDLFKMQWFELIFKVFNVPPITLPVVKNTSDSFGSTQHEIFGASISINAVVGDQQASMFGAHCFEYGDINCTMGTGSFINVNTGNLPLAAYHGFYPLVGWTINSETSYIGECGVHDTGTIISWAQKLGLFDEPCHSSSIADSVSDSDGVFFLPPLNVLQDRHLNAKSSAFVGLKMHTSKEHMVRSVLEALAFQVCMMYDIITQKSPVCKDTAFRICGGVSKNDFIVQLISDLTQRPVHRLKHIETSSLGAAFLAGLHSGIWKNLNDIASLPQEKDIFIPNKISKDKYCNILCNWSKAVSQSLSLKTVLV